MSSRQDPAQTTLLASALAPLVKERVIHAGRHDAADLTDKRLGETLDRERPDAVLVQGDTAATVAGARAGCIRRLPVLRVGAGLRSFRFDTPEERDRVHTDQLADVLFAPTAAAEANLELEGVGGAIHRTGDVLADMLLATAPRLEPGRPERPYLLAALDKDHDTAEPGRLRSLLACLGTSPWPVVLPVQAGTRARIEAVGLGLPTNLELREPATYREMLVLERDAVAIATDSGAVQREAYLWGVPCLTLGEETEWVETVSTGWNSLVGNDPKRFRAALAAPRPPRRPALFGDGRAAEQIAGLVYAHLVARERSVA